jgi:hypothetical protein
MPGLSQSTVGLTLAVVTVVLVILLISESCRLASGSCQQGDEALYVAPQQSRKYPLIPRAPDSCDHSKLECTVDSVTARLKVQDYGEMIVERGLK